MKITPNSIPHSYRGTNESTKTACPSAAPKKISKNFDEIIIHSKNTVASEYQFVHSLTERITKEIQMPASSYKMDDIQAQVDAGTYQIGIDEIAKKMLLS